MMARANKLLKILGWVFIALGILLLWPLLATTILAVQEGYWPPLFAMLAAIAVFFSGGIWCMKARKSSRLNVEQKLSLGGGIVSGVYCCGFAALAISWGIGARAEDEYFLFLFTFTLHAILYLGSTILFVRTHVNVASSFMIAAGILSLPAGLPALLVAFPIRSANKPKKTAEQIEEEMAETIRSKAFKIEIKGKFNEAIEMYSKVIAEFPETQAARDSQVSLNSLKNTIQEN